MHSITNLIENLGHHEQCVAWDAKQDILNHGKNIIPMLIAALDHSNSKITTEVADILGQLQDASIATVGALIDNCTHHDVSFRCRAIAAIGRIARHPALCIQVLAQLTRDANVDVRRYAVAALGQFGEHARSAVPALVDALHDNDDTVNEFAATILHSLGKLPIEHKPSLQQALTTTHPYVSRYIKLLLADMPIAISENKKLLAEQEQ